MTGHPTRNGLLVLLAGMMLTLVLGSVHAFSVFLEPLEARFDASRSQVSMTYSLALACLTISVLFGHLIYARVRPALLAILVCLIAAAGSVLAARADDLQTVWLGYSVLFGGANGLGYGFALQISAQANPERKGLAMGLVTACYALGAAIAPIPFKAMLNGFGFTGAMMGLAIALAVVAPVVAGLLAKAKAELKVSQPAENSGFAPQRGLMIRLWVGYGTAVAAGLMAIGHATGIARAGGLGDWLVLSAPIVIAVFNMLGSLLGGWLADRATVRQMLMAFPALSAAALFTIALFDSGPVVLFGLAAIGFTYGAIIAVYPAAVASLFGAVVGVRVYGRVFTAWGTAGLLAPWFAGFLYERFGDYQIALAAAGCTALASLLVVWFVPVDHLAGPEPRAVADAQRGTVLQPRSRRPHRL